MNTLWRSILTVLFNIFLIKASCHALGRLCKFVQRCKKFYRIGPRKYIVLKHIPSFLVLSKRDFKKGEDKIYPFFKEVPVLAFCAKTEGENYVVEKAQFCSALNMRQSG